MDLVAEPSACPSRRVGTRGNFTGFAQPLHQNYPRLGPCSIPSMLSDKQVRILFGVADVSSENHTHTRGSAADRLQKGAQDPTHWEKHVHPGQCAPLEALFAATEYSPGLGVTCSVYQRMVAACRQADKGKVNPVARAEQHDLHRSVFRLE